MRLRLVATDLDGTLLRTDGSVSVRTREALAAADRAGVPVLFVTARPIRWLSGFQALVGEHGPAICANGAIVLDVASGEVLEATPIPREAALAAAAALRSAVPGTAFARESLTGFGREPGFESRHQPPPGSPVGELVELLDEGTVKLLARHEALARDDFYERAVRAVGDLVTPSISGDDALIEFGASGVTKASALARVTAGLGVAPADVVAFGDMVNDLPMLEWAGRAVAVANAHRHVFAAADEVAPSNDDDGVAIVLARLLAAR